MTKQNLKIHIKSEEESRQAQECLFKMGCEWCVGTVYSYLSSPYLYVIDGEITYGSVGGFFERHENKQVTLQELKDMAYGNLISGADAKKAWANGENVEAKHHQEVVWEALNDDYFLGVFSDDEYSFRLKPQTIKIGDIEVPKPESEPLKDGGVYYIPEITYEGLHSVFRYSGGKVGKLLLARGFIHRTKEAAIAHALALIKISGGIVDE